jgi:hypothetical protein
VIRFNCSCGKRLKVDDSYVGRHVQCPNCGVKTLVPQASDAGTEDAAPVANDPAAAGLEALAQALKAKPSAAKPVRRDVPALRAMPGRVAPGRSATPARGRKPAPGGKIRPNGRFAKPAGAANNNALYIGLGAALGVIIIVVVAAVLIGGGCEGKSKAPAPPPVPAYTPPTKPAHEGPWPGEMWPEKKWEGK